MAVDEFENQWLSKLSRSLSEITDEETRAEVLRGSENLSSEASREDVARWTKIAVERLDALVGEREKRLVMTGCACRYPESDLLEIREAYERTGQVDLVQKMLQDRFILFLRDSLGLDDELVDDIIRRGWGLAGVRRGDSIVATKIPKSSFIVQYMRETDPEKRRALYCHCSRINHSIGSNTKISPTYCYCGAGFYKALWEYVLGRDVEVEVLESVLNGDDLCRIAVHLSDTTVDCDHST